MKLVFKFAALIIAIFYVNFKRAGSVLLSKNDYVHKLTCTKQKVNIVLTNNCHTRYIMNLVDN